MVRAAGPACRAQTASVINEKVKREKFKSPHLVIKVAWLIEKKKKKTKLSLLH
jgi:hypothetical protein